MPLRWEFDTSVCGEKFSKIPAKERKEFFLNKGLRLVIDTYLMHKSKMDYSELYSAGITKPKPTFQSSDIEKFREYAKKNKVFLNNWLPSKKTLKWFVGYNIRRVH